MSCIARHTGSGVCEASRAPPTVGPTPNSCSDLDTHREILQVGRAHFNFTIFFDISAVLGF